MPVTSGWIRVAKVKDDGGKSNRYAKGKKGGKTKGKKATQGGVGGLTEGTTNVSKSAFDADGASHSSTQSESDADDSDSDGIDEELMYRHSSDRCALCRQSLVKTDATLLCLFCASSSSGASPGASSSSSNAEFHILCLSKHFLKTEKAGFAVFKERQIIPVTGECPKCRKELRWGDLIRFKRGCYRKELDVGVEGGGGGDEEHWADMLTQR